MTLRYVTSNSPLWIGDGLTRSAAEVDENFYTIRQEVVAVADALAAGKMLDPDEPVTVAGSSATFHFTDATTLVIGLPIATMSYAGQWANSTAYVAGQLFSARGRGLYQVLVDHTTPDAPAVFDPDAVTEDTDADPLYSFWLPLYDVNYDAAIFVPGSVQRDANDVLFQAVAGRSMQFTTDDGHAYAYLDIGNDETDATDIILSIQVNRVEIGTITFEANGTIDGDGGQLGAFNVPSATNIPEGDIYSVRVTQSDNATPSGLSITLPFLRTDI